MIFMQTNTTPPTTTPPTTTSPPTEFILVYGPPCSGKTLNVEAIRELFHCDHVHDCGLVLGAKIPWKPGRTLILVNAEDLPGLLDSLPIIGMAEVGAAAAALGERWIKPVPSFHS